MYSYNSEFFLLFLWSVYPLFPFAVPELDKQI